VQAPNPSIEATEFMLEMAGIGPGQHVLDLAAGAGEQTIVIGKRVGPTGSVLAPTFLPTFSILPRRRRFRQG